MLAKPPLPARAGLLTALLLTLVACNFGAPPQAPQSPSPQVTDSTPEFISSNTIASEQAALFTRGLTSSATVTVNGKTVLSSGASLHGNGGYTLNGNITVSGTVSASSATAICVDNARLNACVNGKPKTLIAPITVPTPSYNGFVDDYKPGSFDKTLEGNQDINSAGEFSSKFPKGSTVWVKGNLNLNGLFTLEDTTLYLEGNLNVNAGIKLKNSVVLAQQVGINGSSSTLEDSVLVAAKNLDLSSALTSSGQSTLFAAQDLSLNAKFSSSGQLALLSKGNLRLNSGTQPNTRAILWSGGMIDLNGSSTLEGGILAGGMIRINGSLELVKGAEVSNPDLPGYTPKINTMPASSTGTLAPGGTYVGLDGVKVSLPKNFPYTIQIIVERLDPATIKTTAFRDFPNVSNLYRIRASRDQGAGLEGIKIEIPSAQRLKLKQLDVYTLSPTDQENASMSSLIYNNLGATDYTITKSGSIVIKSSEVRKNVAPIYYIGKTQDNSGGLQGQEYLTDFKPLNVTPVFVQDCRAPAQLCNQINSQQYLTLIANSYQNYTDLGFNVYYNAARKYVLYIKNTPQYANSFCASGDAAAFYTSGFIYFCANTAGALPSYTQVKHEFWHAVQDAYQANKDDAVGWITEGMANSASVSNLSDLNVDQSSPFFIKPITERLNSPYIRDRTVPNRKYLNLLTYATQDFWSFAGGNKGKDIDYFKSILNSRYDDPITDVSRVMQQIGYLGGLKEAYWDWVKYQSIEKGSPVLWGGTTCELDKKVVNVAESVWDYSQSLTSNSSITLSALTGNGVIVNVNNAISGDLWFRLKGNDLKYRVYKLNGVRFEGNCKTGTSDLTNSGKLVEGVNSNSKILILFANTDYTQGSTFQYEADGGNLVKPQNTTIQAPSKNFTFSLNIGNTGRAPASYKVNLEASTASKAIAELVLTNGVQGKVPAFPGPDKYQSGDYPFKTASVQGTCKKAGTATWNLRFDDPGAGGEGKWGTTTFSIKCRGGLAITKQADPVTLQLGDPPASSTFALKNEGDVSLEYVATTANASNSIATLSVASSSGNLPDQTPRTENRTITCNWVGGTAFNIEAKTVPDDSAPVGTGLSVSCKPPPCPDLRFHAYKECFPDRNFGDPHIRTRDGLDYNFQGLGEFIMVRSSVADMPLEYQLRFRRVSDLASMTSAAAVRVGTDRVAVYSRSSTQLEIKVNGETLLPDATGNVRRALSDNGRLLYNDTYKEGFIYWNDGSNLYFRNLQAANGHLKLIFNLHGRHQNQTAGLGGNFNANPSDDLQLRDGTVLPVSPTFEQFYRQFGNDWRVSQADSLFDYGPGESTETYTDRNFPLMPQSITAEQRAWAQSVCRAAGVLDLSVLESCIYDVVATGDGSFATAAAQSDTSADLIAIVPEEITLKPGDSTVLTATLPRDRQTAEVEWSAPTGLFERISNKTTRYIAPSAPGTYTLTARATGGQAVARASVTVIRVKSIVVTPNPATVYNRTTTRFTARIENADPGDTLVWSVVNGRIYPSADTLSANYDSQQYVGSFLLYVRLLSNEAGVIVPLTILKRPSFEIHTNSRLDGQLISTHFWLPSTNPFHLYSARPGSLGACPSALLQSELFGQGSRQYINLDSPIGTGTYRVALQNISGQVMTPTSTFYDTSDGSLILFDQVTSVVPVPVDAWWYIGDFDASTRILNQVNQVRSNLDFEPYPDTASGCP